MDSGPRGRAGELTDRRAERGVLDGLAEAVRAGESRVLVVHGEPGVGKTVLLEYLAGGRPGAGCYGWWGCSRRWSWRLPACISCARRCWVGWVCCRARRPRR
ncbi:MAG: ATP-binding protein [Streptosporangiaceae bacterium]